MGTVSIDIFEQICCEGVGNGSGIGVKGGVRSREH